MAASSPSARTATRAAIAGAPLALALVVIVLVVRDGARDPDVEPAAALQETPEYVRWTDVEQIDFDGATRVPANEQPVGGR